MGDTLIIDPAEEVAQDVERVSARWFALVQFETAQRFGHTELMGRMDVVEKSLQDVVTVANKRNIPINKVFN